VILSQIVRDVADLVYPPRCICCNTTADRGALCGDCVAGMAALEAIAACPRCAAPLGEGSDCPYCGGSGIHPFQTIAALGPFRDPLRRLIHRMKYRHGWPIAEVLADRLVHHPRARTVLEQTDCLVAVPLHGARQIGRGYNQAESLAGQLARRCGIQLARPLVRLKNTLSQTAVGSRRQRADNLRHAFGLIRPRAIRERRITLVDDVMTTAATLKSAASALKDAQPRSISALVLAVADERRRDYQAV
jgi:ComF family protein